MGSADRWLRWSKIFKQLLDGKDPRWEPLLEEVEKLRGKPVKGVNEQDWEANLATGPLAPRQPQNPRLFVEQCSGALFNVMYFRGC